MILHRWRDIRDRKVDRGPNFRRIVTTALIAAALIDAYQGITHAGAFAALGVVCAFMAGTRVGR